MLLFADINLPKHTITTRVFYISAFVLLVIHFCLISKCTCLQKLIILFTAKTSALCNEIVPLQHKVFNYVRLLYIREIKYGVFYIEFNVFRYVINCNTSHLS